jgi:outer membrane receptor protein involved in Fe transport
VSCVNNQMIDIYPSDRILFVRLNILIDGFIANTNAVVSSKPPISARLHTDFIGHSGTVWDLAINNNLLVTGGSDNSVVNDDVDDTNYKLSASYRPNDQWLLRTSISTGFKSATMEKISVPRHLAPEL